MTYNHWCERVVDENENIICDKPAYDAIFIRSPEAGKVKVWVCVKHFSEHNRKAMENRTRGFNRNRP